MARGVEALLCTNLAQTFAATALVVMAATNVRPIRTNVPTGKQVFFSPTACTSVASVLVGAVSEA
jgi:hypothetical protein